MKFSKMRKEMIKSATNPTLFDLFMIWIKRH